MQLTGGEDPVDKMLGIETRLKLRCARRKQAGQVTSMRGTLAACTASSHSTSLHTSKHPPLSPHRRKEEIGQEGAHTLPVL